MRLCKWELIQDGTLEVMFDGRWYRYDRSANGHYHFGGVEDARQAPVTIRTTDLRQVVDEQGYTRVEAFRSAPKVGDRVNVERGDFAGEYGELVSIDPDRQFPYEIHFDGYDGPRRFARTGFVCDRHATEVAR